MFSREHGANQYFMYSLWRCLLRCHADMLIEGVDSSVVAFIGNRAERGDEWWAMPGKGL
jgi:hypothetical protein